jgi:hypothetical protein
MSLSWQLFNVYTGDSTLVRGQMDIDIEEGAAVNLPSPDLIASQVVGKSSIERQGSNPFSPTWGGPFDNLLGTKMLPQQVAKQVGSGLRTMITGLVSAQNQIARVVSLDPAETIIGLTAAQVAIATDTLTVVAQIATGDGSQTTASSIIQQ